MKKRNFFQNSTKNGRSGTALTSLHNTNLRTVYNVSKGKKSIRRGVAQIASGTQAVIYLGYYDKEAKRPVSIKVFPTDTDFKEQSAETEFKIGTLLHKAVPLHIPKFFSIERVHMFASLKNMSKANQGNKKNQIVIYSEYFHGGDLKSWLAKVGPRLTENALLDIILQVVSTLVKIQDKYPKFRHNDLHAGNVLVDDSSSKLRVALSDFGLSSLSATIKNTAVESGIYKAYGLGPLTDSRFDVHFFLNVIAGLAVSRSFMRVVQFLSIIPEGYRGKENTYVSNFRLKYNLPDYPGLPSTRQIYRILLSLTKNPTFFSEANLMNVKSRLKKVGVSKHVDAANIAAEALSGMKGVSVSATNFLKLSPKSRKEYIKKNPKPAAAKPKYLKFNVKKTQLAPAKEVKLTHINPEILKSKKFENLIERLVLPENPEKPENTYYVRRNAARNKAMSQIRNRMNRGLLPFSPSPKRAAMSPNKPAPKPVAKPAAKPVGRIPVNRILNIYTRNKNIGALTVRNLKKLLMPMYSAESAKRGAKNWAMAWTNKVAKRRANLKLHMGPNGRIRTSKKLLEGFKRDELVNMAKKFGLAHSGKKKAELIMNLWRK